MRWIETISTWMASIRCRTASRLMAKGGIRSGLRGNAVTNSFSRAGRRKYNDRKLAAAHSQKSLTSDRANGPAELKAVGPSAT